MTDQTLTAHYLPTHTAQSPALAHPRPSALAGWIGLIGAVGAAVLILGLDFVIGGQLIRGRELRQATISEYVFTSGSWAFNTAVIGLGISSAILLFGLVRSRLVRPLSFSSVAMGLWVIGLLGIAAFPKHNWAVGPSASGSIHRVASLVAFLSIPVAVLVIARWRRHSDSRAARWAFWLGIGAVACLAVLFGGIIFAELTDRSWFRTIPLGLIERGIAGFEVAAVGALSVWQIRRSARAKQAR